MLGGSKFISGSDLDNEILVHMPQLHRFSYYMASENVIADPSIRISNSDIEQTFTNIKHGQMGCMVDYFDPTIMICRVFSLPFKFDRLERISNNISNSVFNSVTHLTLWDTNPFKHEFFIRLQRAFPFLKSLSMCNIKPPFWRFDEQHLRDKDWCSIVEYLHLRALDIAGAAPHYAEHFLNERKAHLPRLIHLKIDYDDLKEVTKKFTRDARQCNCSQIKRLIIDDLIVYPKVVYRYFPLLSI
jgi:hypothetical protein